MEVLGWRFGNSVLMGLCGGAWGDYCLISHLSGRELINHVFFIFRMTLHQLFVYRIFIKSQKISLSFHGRKHNMRNEYIFKDCVEWHFTICVRPCYIHFWWPWFSFKNPSRTFYVKILHFTPCDHTIFKSISLITSKWILDVSISGDLHECEQAVDGLLGDI